MSRAIASLLVVGLFAGCGAEPAEVCAHVQTVVEKELGAEAAKAAVDGCEFQWTRRQDMKGALEYKKLADCVMDAKTADELTKCD